MKYHPLTFLHLSGISRLFGAECQTSSRVSPNEFDIPVGNKRNGAVNNCFDFDNQSCLLAKLFFQSRGCTSYFFFRQTKKPLKKEQN